MKMVPYGPTFQILEPSIKTYLKRSLQHYMGRERERGAGSGGQLKGYFFFNSFQTNNEKTQSYRSLLWSQD